MDRAFNYIQASLIDGCKLLIRTDNSIITNGISPSEGWTELVMVARDDKDLICSVSEWRFCVLINHDH